MNLPISFAYDEYINHCLDSTTLKIANNTWITWSTLLAFIFGVAHSSVGEIIFGFNTQGFSFFLMFGLFIVLVNVILLGFVEYAQRTVIGKLGGERDCETELEQLRNKWPKPGADDDEIDFHETLRDVEQKLIEDARVRHEQKHHLTTGVVAPSIKNITDGIHDITHISLRMSTIRRGIKSIGYRLKSTEHLAGLGFNVEDFRRFQVYFMALLRVGNMFQAFYIALIMSHWCWYAPSSWAAVLILVPLLIIYVGITPLIVRRYAMVMSLGKPDPRAMSLTIEYMEHNEQALHQVAELIVGNKSETETIDDVFQDWDANGDGELSFKELQNAMHESNMHMQKERFEAMWRKIDIDSSGSISKDEFKKAISLYVENVEQKHASTELLKKQRLEGVQVIRKSLDFDDDVNNKSDLLSSHQKTSNEIKEFPQESSSSSPTKSIHEKKSDVKVGDKTKKKPTVLMVSRVNTAEIDNDLSKKGSAL